MKINRNVGIKIVMDGSGAVKSIEKVSKATDQLDNSLAQVNKTAKSTVNNIANVSKATKQTGKSLSDSTRDIKGTTMAMVNFNRIVQDAPFGILGISNNIEPMVSSFQKLQTQTGSTRGAIKQLATSLLTGPGAMITAVSVVTSLLVVFRDKLFQSKKTVDETKESVEALSNAFNKLVKENRKLNDLNAETTMERLSAAQKEEEDQLDLLLEAQENFREFEKKRFEDAKNASQIIARTIFNSDDLEDEEERLEQIIERRKEALGKTEKEIETMLELRESKAAQRIQRDIQNKKDAIEREKAFQEELKRIRGLNDTDSEVMMGDPNLGNEMSLMDHLDMLLEQDEEYFAKKKEKRDFWTDELMYLDEQQYAFEASLNAEREANDEAMLNRKINRLKREQKEQQEFTSMFLRMTQTEAAAVKDVAADTANAMRREVKANLAAGLSVVIKKAVTGVPFPFNIGAAAAAAGAFNLLFNNVVPKFEKGGMVGGRRHSQGGTIIEAEQGEYVVNRNSASRFSDVLDMINSGASRSEAAVGLANSESMANSQSMQNIKVSLSMYDLNQAQRQFNQVQIGGGVL